MPVEQYLEFVRFIFIFQMAICIAMLSYIHKYKMNPVTKKKLKIICKLEGEKMEKHLDRVIEMYIDAYAKKNQIDWNNYL